MSSILSPYPDPSPPLLPSLLLRDPPDKIPPTGDLEAIQAELKSVEQKVHERIRKARYDLKAIEESARRMYEKEKAKAKALGKPRKDGTCA